MTTLSLSDLFAPETRENVLADLLAVAAAVKLKTTAWQEGQPIRTALVLVSQKVADLTELTNVAVRGGLLDYAEGGWLTLLAASVYRVTRNPAQYAKGDSFSIANSGTESYDRAPGEITIAHNVTGKTYHNVADVSVAPGTTLPNVTFEADEVGTGSDAGPDTIQQLVTSAANIAITNARAVLGADEELDEDLRQRCRDKLGALSPNGPKEAYSYVVKTPSLTPTSVPITRTQIVLNKATGVVTVYCATAAGAPTVDDIAIADASIDRWATPWLVDAVATRAEQVVANLAYHVWIEGSNLSVPQTEAVIAAALSRLFKIVPIGGHTIEPDGFGRVYVDTIKAEILRATGGIVRLTITGGVINTLEDAIVMVQGQVLVLGAITPTITVVT